MFGTMIHLRADGEYGRIYQKVQAYLTQHFARLPKVDVYYDAEGTIRSENQRHQIVTGGLVVVEIHATGSEDTIGLLFINDHLELDAVSASALSELRTVYGYHE